MGSFTLYPALDLRGGRVVRLAQGDYARETQYGDDPLPRAAAFAAAGARWMHLVDLDAARAGGYTLAPLLADIARDTGLQVQTGGGVRSREDVLRILEAGASRVVVGSLAVREPEAVAAWLAEFGGERGVGRGRIAEQGQVDAVGRDHDLGGIDAARDQGKAARGRPDGELAHLDSGSVQLAPEQLFEFSARAGLHPGRDFLAAQFEQEVSHQTRLHSGNFACHSGVIFSA